MLCNDLFTIVRGDQSVRTTSSKPVLSGAGCCLGAAWFALALAGPAHGQPLALAGDGSGFDNPSLLEDSATGCETCAPTAPRASPGDWFDPQWSIALRGTYVQAPGGGYFEVGIVPSVTLQHESMRGGYDISASAELLRPEFEEVRLGSVSASWSGSHQLDAVTEISGDLDLSLSQASARAPGTDPTIAIQPLVFSGVGTLEAERQLGLLVVSVRGDLARTIHGPTTLVDASVVDNGAQSNWAAGGGLRLGYRVTPILTPFIDARVGYQWYDAPSPDYLVAIDALDVEGRVGVAAAWNSVFEAEASVGYALRRFAEPTLGEAGGLIFDASVSARPDETLELKGALSAGFDAPGAGSGAIARLQHTATASAAYRVNSWLALRASAGWRHAELVGTGGTETRYDLGAGVDYLVNELTTLTADYGYSQSAQSPDPTEDEHRLTLGITVSR